jgi:2-polyprenyl-6-methoxyphenol hydroxylase-like FAD-dependent oxidoreductase
MTRGAGYDVVIIGGSPGGSATAIALRGLGLSVALIEREPAFRDRARGEGLHPWGVDEAEDLGLLPHLVANGVHALPIWQNYADREPGDPYRWEEDSARGHSECGVAFPRLQQAMLDLAAQSGVAVHRPVAMSGISQITNGWQVELDSGSRLSARLLIGADGSHSRTRTLLGIKATSDPRHHWFAGLLIRNIDLVEDSAHAGMFPGGRFFILPQGGGHARAYMPLMPDRVGPIQADRSGRTLIQRLAELLPIGSVDRADPAGPQGIFSNADIWPERRSGPMAVLVGDAAGANDPSFGHGASLALRDARELRDLISAYGISQEAIDRFAALRSRYYETLRAFVSWVGPIMFEEGEVADARRAAYAAARETDPDAGGFAQMTALGPRDLVADDAARLRLLGEPAEVDAV